MVIGFKKKGMKTHKDLDAWKNAVALTSKIYTLTKSFPKDEIYCLTNQMRRAAISIPSNIAEGAARNSDLEFIRFLNIAQGSLSELDTQLIISFNLNYIDNELLDEFNKNIVILKKQIYGLMNFLKKNQ